MHGRWCSFANCSQLSAAESFFSSFDEKPDVKPNTDKKPKLDKGKGRASSADDDDDDDVEEIEEVIPPSSKTRQLL